MVDVAGLLNHFRYIRLRKPLVQTPSSSLILPRANSLHIHVPYWVHVHIFQATVKDCQNDNEGDG